MKLAVSYGSAQSTKMAKLLRCGLAILSLMAPIIAMADTGLIFRSASFSDLVQGPTVGLAATQLVSVSQGSSLSDKAADARKVQYESSTGESISMQPWYDTKWVDVHIIMMTPVSSSAAVLWGFSTGERGIKYRIDPSVTLGWAQVWEPAKGHTLAFNMKYLFGGKLKENTCSADYGDIGGVQDVNCRLAATTLAPEETLRYLFNENPKRKLQANLTWRYVF